MPRPSRANETHEFMETPSYRHNAPKTVSIFTNDATKVARACCVSNGRFGPVADHGSGLCSAAEAAAAEKGDDNEMRDDGRSSEMLYDLYGVIHHQGALSGGHYVASLRSELDGQWRLFNDAQI